MKFVFVCSSLSGGGAERVAVNLANSLVDFGHTVTVFIRRDSQDSYKLDARVFRYTSVFSGIVGQISSLRRLIDRESADAVFAFTDVPNIVSYFAVKLARVKPIFVPTVHTNLKARDQRLSNGVRVKIIHYLHRLACRYSDSVVSVSDGGRQALIDYYGVPEHKVVKIFNPVIDDYVNISKRNPSAEVRKVRLVAAGRLTEAKNYPLMLDAMKRLSEIHPGQYTLDIYGDGDLEGELKEYARKLDVSNVVTFKGFVTDFKSRLSAFDIFIFTSDWEGFGNVLVEALCSGIPVISTDCPSGPREILADGKFGRLVPVNDVRALCEAVEQEVRKPLDVCHVELSRHLDKFRNGVVAQKYIELVDHV
ncbi:glycosyltransferase [Idiomarina abyssalis]|uniref:glycosyltransferase n=1 Tax=Idiomarina abyssalis TaxID=86102 RepID=UPI003A8CD169